MPTTKQKLSDRIADRVAAHIAGRMAPTHLCLDCHSRIRPTTHLMAAAVLLTIATLFLAGSLLSGQPFGLIIVCILGALGVFLHVRRGRCDVCGSSACIPLTSPRAKELTESKAAT